MLGSSVVLEVAAQEIASHLKEATAHAAKLAHPLGCIACRREHVALQETRLKIRRCGCLAWEHHHDVGRHRAAGRTARQRRRECKFVGVTATSNDSSTVRR